MKSRNQSQDLQEKCLVVFLSLSRHFLVSHFHLFRPPANNKTTSSSDRCALKPTGIFYFLLYVHYTLHCLNKHTGEHHKMIPPPKKKEGTATPVVFLLSNLLCIFACNQACREKTDDNHHHQSATRGFCRLLTSDGTLTSASHGVASRQPLFGPSPRAR